MLLAAAALAACAGPATPQRPMATAPSPAIGTIPAEQSYVPVTTADGSATVAVPRGWTRTAGGASLLLTSGFDSVAIDTAVETDPPTVKSTLDDVLPTLRAINDNFVPGDVRTVDTPAGPAVLCSYNADSQPGLTPGPRVTLSFERYELWRLGHDVVLTLSSPAGVDNTAAWHTIVDSVRWRDLG